MELDSIASCSTAESNSPAPEATRAERKPGMKLKEGYSLVWGERSSRLGCGAGTTVEAFLMKNGSIVERYVTCPCGRGCGDKDIVVDAWGDHDCESAIEAVRVG